MAIKILCFTSPNEDYLQDSLIHGLMTFPEIEVYDFPKKKILYNSFKDKFNVRGGGFTLYYTLENYEQYDEGDILNKLTSNPKYFDYIIFSNIQRQFGYFIQYFPYLDPQKTFFFDGEDTPGLYKYHGFFWRRPYLWFLPKVNSKSLYFKRELLPESIVYLWYNLLPRNLAFRIFTPKNIRKVAFSIPQDKIVKFLPVKVKDFPKHIVDEEVAKQIEGSCTRYAFMNESDYYLDLQRSRFGITTKRSGWDCLRHYEIAANGALICFRDLHKKPDTCAPHGLIPGQNCLSYRSWEDLKQQINLLNEEQYILLQKGSWEWAKKNTTINRIKELLNEFNFRKGV